MSDDGILQKSARKSRRIRVEADCTVSIVNTSKVYTVELCDLSQDGMGFFVRSPVMQENTLVQFDFRIAKVKPFSIRGRILSQVQMKDLEANKAGIKTKFRCSVRFESRLKEDAFKLLLGSFDLAAPELKSS